MPKHVRILHSGSKAQDKGIKQQWLVGYFCTGGLFYYSSPVLDADWKNEGGLGRTFAIVSLKQTASL